MLSFSSRARARSWAIVGWNQHDQGESFRGFVNAVPAGKFIVVDMSVDGTGEWQQWNNASFFGAPFIWTALHNFGGTDGMRGNLAHLNALPFSGLPSGGGNTTAIGMGQTPEGIDQNPAYYSLLVDATSRLVPEADVTAATVLRQHRRYGLVQPSAAVTSAWTLLVNSSYAQDLSVQDDCGVPHFPGASSQFEADRATPSPRLCLEWQAWGALLGAAQAGEIDATLETVRYDLVNLGRELLAQLSTPVSQNFSDAINGKAGTLDAARITATGQMVRGKRDGGAWGVRGGGQRGARNWLADLPSAELRLLCRLASRFLSTTSILTRSAPSSASSVPVAHAFLSTPLAAPLPAAVHRPAHRH